MPNLEELKFVRIIVPELFAFIPRYLFEQIKEIDEEAIDAIYENAASIMTVPVMNEKGVVVGRLPAVNVWIAGLHDISHQIKGFLWAEFDIIEKRIFVQACSVDKEYQSNNGELLEKVKSYLLNLPILPEFKQKICWSTIQPKAFERRGFKRSQKILMEYKNVGYKDTETNNKN